MLSTKFHDDRFNNKVVKAQQTNIYTFTFIILVRCNNREVRTVINCMLYAAYNKRITLTSTSMPSKYLTDKYCMYFDTNFKFEFIYMWIRTQVMFRFTLVRKLEECK